MLRQPPRIQLAVIILALLLSLSGHGAAAFQERPGNFGVLLPLSGSLKALGEKTLQGILLGTGLLAANAKGGVVFHLYDTQSTAEGAAKGMDELWAKGVVAVIGPLKGDEARAAAAKAIELKLPLMPITPARNVSGGEVFRLYLGEEEEADRLSRYAIDSLGMRRFAILAPDTEQGRLYRKVFWDAVVRNGGEIAGAELFTPGENISIKDQIQKLTGVYNLSEQEVRELYEEEKLAQEAAEREMLSGLGNTPKARAQSAVRTRDYSRYKPTPRVDFDAVFLPVSSVEAGQLAPMFPYYDVFGVPLLGIRSWNYSALLKVGKEYVDNARFPVEFSEATGEGRKFIDSFEKAYERDPGPLEAYGFDGAGLLVEAWRSGRAESREKVAEFLKNLSGQKGVTGPFRTLPSGDIAAEAKIITVRKGRFMPQAEEGR